MSYGQLSILLGMQIIVDVLMFISSTFIWGRIVDDTKELTKLSAENAGLRSQVSELKTEIGRIGQCIKRI